MGKGGVWQQLFESLADDPDNEYAGVVAVILPKRNRTIAREYDKHLYKARHLIENFFARRKQYRAIATRYDKRAQNFLGAIYLAAAVIWLN